MAAITGTAILGAAGISAAAALGSGAIQAGAANKAADAQVNAANQSAQVQKYIYDQTREDFQPFRQIGLDAMDGQNGLRALLGLDGQSGADRTRALRETPGYKFRMDEGTRAVEASLAARGLTNSGAGMKELMRYGQGVADQGYQSRVNNLFNATNIGSGAQAQTAAAGQNYATGMTNAYTNIGNARAGGAMNRASAFSGALNGAVDAGMQGFGMYGGYKGWF
ncbi:MAG: hypothetical protein AAFQ22_07150 [Pseudomonadota bacterium]